MAKYTLTPEQHEFFKRLKFPNGSARYAAMKALARGAMIVDIIDPRDIFIRDGWRCKRCGKPTPESLMGKEQRASPTLDHVVPIVRGGEHAAKNCRCLCQACNYLKLDKLDCELEVSSQATAA